MPIFLCKLIFPSSVKYAEEVIKVQWPHFSYYSQATKLQDVNVENQNCGRKTEKLLLGKHFTKCGTSEYGDYWPLVRSDKRGKQEDTQNNQYKCKNFAWTTAIEWIIRAAFRVYTMSKKLQKNNYISIKNLILPSLTILPLFLFSTRNTASAAKCALKMYSEENTLVAIGEKKAAHNIWMYETWTFPLEVMNWACWVRSVNFTQALVKSSAHPGPWRTGQ